MITTLPPRSARSAEASQSASRSEVASAPRAADYRLLGLRPREARVEVIRQAVHDAANQVQLDSAAQRLLEVESSSSESTSDSQQLAQIAVAGYRLLDPRRRRTLFERVQLLMWTEEELDTTIKTLWSGQPEPPPKVRIAIRPPQRAVANVGEVQENEERVALELFRSMRKRDRRALALWIGLASLTFSLTITLALFAWLA